MVCLCVLRGDEELKRVETETEDDFFYFRDSIHNALEEGDPFGSRFPVFMLKDEWKVAELGELKRELETIAQAFKKMPPKPLDVNWESKAWRSGKRYRSLYEVFTDAHGRPLLGELIQLSEAAQKEDLPIFLR